MNELQKRVATAVVLIPSVLYLIFFLENPDFKIAMSVMLVLASWEWSRLIGLREIPAQAVYIALALIIAFLVQYLPSILIYLVAALWWLSAVYLVATYPESESLWDKNLFIKAFIGYAILIPTWLGVVELQLQSPWLMMFVFVLVWAADIGAYFSGRKFGKNKLAPKVSPGKSIEGLLGGLIISLVIGLGLKSFVVGLNELSIIQAIMVFSTVVLFSVLGDLSESLFKRSSGVKDSSQLLPGHGGILDRIDSLTAAVPIYFVSIFFFT